MTEAARGRGTRGGGERNMNVGLALVDLAGSLHGGRAEMLL